VVRASLKNDRWNVPRNATCGLTGLGWWAFLFLHVDGAVHYTPSDDYDR
jgi:hypothetical protein